MSGVAMERRDQVLIGRLLFSATAFSTLRARCASTKGPFLTERGTIQSSWLSRLLARATAAHNHVVGALVLARLVALGGLAPRAHRMTPAGGAALTTAVRMVHRVHDHAAHGRAHTAPTLRAGLAKRAQ